MQAHVGIRRRIGSKMAKVIFESVEYDVNANSNGHDTFFINDVEYYFMYNNKNGKLKGFSIYTYEPPKEDDRPHADFTATINSVEYGPGEEAEIILSDPDSSPDIVFNIDFKNKAGNILTGFNARIHTPVHIYIVDSRGVKTLGYRQVLIDVAKGKGLGKFTVKHEGIHEISQNEAKKAIIAAPFRVMVSA